MHRANAFIIALVVAVLLYAACKLYWLIAPTLIARASAAGGGM